MQKRLNLFFREFIQIVIIGTVFYLIISNLFPKQTSKFLTGQNYTYPDSISCGEAYQLIKSKPNSVIFIDSRYRGFYEKEHILNALSIPIQDWDVNKNQILGIIDKRTVIITYCDSHICGLSKQMAALIANEDYFKNVYYLSGGIDKWNELGLPIEKRDKKDVKALSSDMAY